MKYFENKTVFITGTAYPRGMGFATAKKFASLGANVVLTDIDDSQLQAAAAEIEAFGVKAMGIKMDVTNPKQVEAAVQKTVDTYGSVDIVFNNAGLGKGVGDFLDISLDEWDLVLDVNLKGMVVVSRTVIPHMIKQGGGNIINNASIGGLYGEAGYSAYSVSKFGVVGLAKCLAAEFGKHQIRVNVVCPGWIKTNMGDKTIEFVSEYNKMTEEEATNFMKEMIALQRPASPDEVANTVAFLASPASSYITGIALPVTGGMMTGL